MVTSRQSGDGREDVSLDFLPPAQKYPVGKIAWKIAVASAYSLAVLCTLYSIVLLRLTGFTTAMVLPLLFWNILPWLFAAQMSRRARMARAMIARAEAQSAERRLVLAQAVEMATAKIAAKSPQSAVASRGSRHWWTDTQLREETVVKVQQR